jgi:hypothetical protein
MDCINDEALPSKGMMECNHSGKAYLDKATARTIQLDLDNQAIDRAIAECYQAMYNQEMAPDASSKVAMPSLPIGGKSRDKFLVHLSTVQPNHFRKARGHQQDSWQKA